MAWKYVMLNNGTLNVPIIFPALLVHADVALAIKAQLPGKWAVISAGTIEDITTAGVGGSSETLGTSSRGKIDEKIIDHYAVMGQML